MSYSIFGKVQFIFVQILKKGEERVQNSRTYYGATFLGEEDLKETNIKHRIELEYYTTKNNINKVKDKETTYGIEIIKKEYLNNKIGIETETKEQISNNSQKVIEIIDTLKKYKVTPIGLNDVLEDLLKAN